MPSLLDALALRARGGHCSGSETWTVAALWSAWHSRNAMYALASPKIRQGARAG